METSSVQHTSQTQSKAALWTGRTISTLCILFLLSDAIMKIVREAHSVQGTFDLGWPDSSVRVLGTILLVCTILYIIPLTSVLGAILLTGYLGGAIATGARIDAPYIFALVFGVLVWAGLFLRDARLRTLIPVKRED
jgi:hypothetical protein